MTDSYGNQRQLGDRLLIDIYASTRWRLGTGGRDLADVRSCQKKRLRNCDSFSRIIRSLAKLAFSDIKSLV